MPREFDCVVVGAGLAGAALAIGLARFGLKVAAVDARKPVALVQGGDVRGLALAVSSQRLLNALNLWPKLAPRLTPIRRIEVSARGHFGGSTLCAEDVGLPALGHICPADHLQSTLDTALLNTPGLTPFFGAALAQLTVDEASVQLRLADSEPDAALRCRLVIAADGSQSAVRRHYGIEATHHDYQQTAIVANVDIARAQPDTACERLTAHGPCALLPLGGTRQVLVRTVPREQADRWLAASADNFLADVQQDFGWRLGRFSGLGERRAHPLVLNRANALTAPRAVLVGNAANTIHPNAAQGLNLALRDVAVLLESLKDCSRTGEDPGEATRLAAYAERRRADHARTVQFSDGLARLFALDWPLLGVARGAALVACDALPGLRRAVMRRLMGLGAPPPDWLRAAYAHD